MQVSPSEQNARFAQRGTLFPKAVKKWILVVANHVSQQYSH